MKLNDSTKQKWKQQSIIQVSNVTFKVAEYGVGRCVGLLDISIQTKYALTVNKNAMIKFLKNLFFGIAFNCN